MRIRLGFFAAALIGLGVVVQAGDGFAQAQRPAAPPAPARPAAPPPPAADDDADPVEKCFAQQAPDKITACLTKVLTDSEKEIDTLMKKGEGIVAKRAGIPPAEKENWKKAITESHATWKRFVELECTTVVAREAMGSPQAAIVPLACRAALTAQRATDLDNRFTEQQ